MLLLIDNFDSFTYNLFHAFQALEVEICVVRANSKTIQACVDLSPHYLVIGPGPGSPEQALFSKELVKACEHIPMLGICLGHQILAHNYGACVKQADLPMHGKTSEILHTGKGIFRNLPQKFTATRYHSLLVESTSLPACLEITAYTQTGEIMGLCHKTKRQESVQFHPESVLTTQGVTLLQNFIYPFSQKS